MMEVRILLAIHIVAVLVFSLGFFQIKKIINSEFPQETAPPIYEKLVFVVIDALRQDFVFGENSQFKFVKKVLEEGKGIGFVGMAQAPTVTMPRLKALTAGTPPVFVDLLLNFDEGDHQYKEDSWVKRLHEVGKKMVFYGDDTWLRLFPGVFERSYPVTSFYVNDWINVDNSVTHHLDDELNSNDWDALILHYLGVDHIGHCHGAFNPIMEAKHREMDAIIEKIYQKVPKNTLIVVCGDHGMTDSGNHGGSSPAELETALLFLSPAMNRRKQSQINVVNQIDVAPTISLLFGIPIPQRSTGKLIEALFPSPNQYQRLNLRQLTKSDVHTSNDLSQELNRVASEQSQNLGSYKLSYLYFGIFASAILTLYTFSKVKESKTLISMSLLYSLSLFSSSFIEEEHNIWYYFYPTLALLENKIDSSLLKSLLFFRSIIYWNSVGDKHSNRPDIKLYLKDHLLVSQMLSAFSLISTFLKNRSKLFLLAASLLFLYKFTTFLDNVLVARAIYFIVILLLFSNFSTSVTILSMLLQRSHNIFPIYAISIQRPLKIETKIALIHASYFLLGNCNLISSIDFSHAYAGLYHFNPYVVFPMGFIAAWAGPILVASNSFEGKRNEDRFKLLFWKSVGTLSLFICLTIQRHHLFIWSVFAPRLVFEWGWVIFYSFLILI